MQVYVYTAYLDSVVDSLPATPTKLKQIKSAQTSDDICKRLSRYIANGWPRHRREQLLYYWPNQSVLHEKRGLLMKGERLIIPECMRPDIKQWGGRTGHQNCEVPSGERGTTTDGEENQNTSSSVTRTVTTTVARS
ncbi:uncharacterized protein K02A2.6-like [Tachysurus ichikawai]